MDELRSIIEGCQRHDDYWQHRLYEVFSPRYYALCLRYCHSHEEAEDMLVKGFAKVFGKIEGYKGGDFASWMFGIFANTALDQLRHQRRKEHDRVVDEMPEATIEEDHAMQMDVKAALDKALRLLPEAERVIFNMYAVDGCSFQETAELLEMPLSTIKTKYYRTRTLMQRYMTRILGPNYQDE